MHFNHHGSKGSAITVSVVVMVMAAYLMVAMQIYFPNMGGNGLSLPVNYFAWMLSLSVIFIVGYNSLVTRRYLFTARMKWLLLAALLYSLPLLWTPHAIWREGAMPRVLGIWGGVIFYWALQQLSLTTRHKVIIWSIIAIAVFEQAIMALLQLLIPNKLHFMEFNPDFGRPYGIFQQVNLLASFLAVGYAIALLLWCVAVNKMVKTLLAIAVLILVFIITVIQSRIGWLSCLVILVTFLIYSRLNKSCLEIFILSFISFAAALLFINYGPEQALIDKSGSNDHRWMMLRIALELIALKPLVGWGYGSTSWAMGNSAEGRLDTARLLHPHNEWLYGWLEGGIFAVAAMAIILIVLALPLLRKRAVLQWLPLSPLLLHTQTEYPLYQSSLHWVLLLLLCRLAEPEGRLDEHKPSRFLLLLPASQLIMCLAGIVVLSAGLYSQSLLTKYERQGLQDAQAIDKVPFKWLMKQRSDYDYHIALLQQYNYSRDTELLKQFSLWAEQHILTQNDPAIYYDLVRIKSHLNHVDSEKWRRQAQHLFPDDPRFGD